MESECTKKLKVVTLLPEPTLRKECTTGRREWLQQERLSERECNVGTPEERDL
jgi:hypothetical protein